MSVSLPDDDGSNKNCHKHANVPYDVRIKYMNCSHMKTVACHLSAHDYNFDNVEFEATANMVYILSFCTFCGKVYKNRMMNVYVLLVYFRIQTPFPFNNIYIVVF